MTTHVPETGWSPVQANGIQFACLEEGEGPLVLLLHGFPDTARTWDKIMAPLAKAGFRVVAPFLRGYAPTEVPALDTDVETLGRDALALIEALGEERAIVVGHDWGAAAAYAAAALEPGRVEKLVTVAIPHPNSLKPHPLKLWGARHFVELKLPGAAKRLARNDAAGIRKYYERWSPTWDVPDSELEGARNAFRVPGSLHAALGYYRMLSPIPPAFMKRAISVPTMCIGGTDDGVATEADFERGRRMFSGPYTVVMTPGGHFLHREAPAAFEHALLGFLTPS
jgi:pimeloyl-ACP methyl ester carboxylesterase